MQNLEVSFEIKASKEYKNMTREISKIVYKGDQFIRIKGLCDAVLCLGWTLVVTFLCVKFWRHDIGGLLEDYGYCEVSYLPAFVWFGSPVLFFYSFALRPYLLMRTLLGKANFSEMGRKSVTLGDDFLIQRSELGEGRYYYHTISDVRDASGFVVIIIQNAMYIAIPREAFADGGAEFCAELRAKLAGLKKG